MATNPMLEMIQKLASNEEFLTELRAIPEGDNKALVNLSQKFGLPITEDQVATVLPMIQQFKAGELDLSVLEKLSGGDESGSEPYWEVGGSSGGGTPTT